MFIRSDKLYVRGTDVLIGIDERTVTVMRAGTISSQPGQFLRGFDERLASR